MALAAFGICYGILFKLQHYPGASILLIVGFGFAALNFMLSLSHSSSEGSITSIYKNNYGRVVQILQGIGTAIVILGAIFNNQHYPGANILQILGWNLIMVNLVVRAFKQPKDFEEPDISDFGKEQD